MIKQITSDVKIEEYNLRRLVKSHYSRKIISHFDAYGLDFDFCRFFAVISDGVTLGIISVFNSSMIAETFEGKQFGDEAIADMAFLLRVNKPKTAELSPMYAKELIKHVGEAYTLGQRHEFEFQCKNALPELEVDEFPKLDDVFEILKTGFPELADSYDLWLTDTSHRIRRGYSQAFLLHGCTTATIQYIVYNKALIGQVATLPEFRGNKYARMLLYWIGEKLNMDGISVFLFARDHRRSYYEEIGFKKINEDYVLDLKGEEV